MTTIKRLDLVASCGLDCGLCELYVCGHNHDLYLKFVERGIPKDKLPCDGCKSVEGNCPVAGAVCETYKCATGKEVGFCFECNEFPCEKLHPAANRADILPHNMKVFNLCTIKRIGLDAFVERSPAIKKRYYAGRVVIGEGPKV